LGSFHAFISQTSQGTLVLSIFEEGVPPEFRIVFKNWKNLIDYQTLSSLITVTTIRTNSVKQVFHFEALLEENCLHSTESIPEPHNFQAEVQLFNRLTNKTEKFSVEFKEPADEDDDHNHSSHHHQNNFSILDDDDDHHSNGHGHGHGHDHNSHDETRRIKVSWMLLLYIMLFMSVVLYHR
jgi:hypothetical protein